MIPPNLLEMTASRAIGICIYGGPGMKKTLGVHTCPPPIELHEFEEGDECLMPWIRRVRRWDEGGWTPVSQEIRQAAYDMLSPSIREENEKQGYVKPAPYIDIIRYNSLEWECYDQLVVNISNFRTESYNTLAVDSLQEFSQETQTFSKGRGNELTPMTVNLWGGAQERAAILLRKMRNFRGQGVFIYLTGSEQIDKDYVTDPRETKKGVRVEEPYSVKGTVALPGKLAGTLPHLVDVMMHARPQLGSPIWVSQPEPLPGGSAHWEAKDRSGRISDTFIKPSVRRILDYIYTESVRKAIYAEGLKLISTV